MATRAKDIYTADGTTQVFSITFPFISRTHVSVTVAGVSATFSFNNDSQITISTPTVVNGNQVIIKRETSDNIRLVDYVDGSNLTEADLDLDSKQAFYMAQEALDEAKTVGFADLDGFSDATVSTTTGDILITNGTEFANKTMSGDATIASTGVLTISDESIDSDHYVDGSIDNEHIADNAINSEHYAAGSIDLEHMSAESIDSDQYVDGSIDGVHIANDAVDSQHYAAGSIDSEHLSPNCVVSAKVEDNSLVNADINTSAAIDATKIHNGTVTNTEFSYINTLTSNVQTQLDSLVAGAVTDVPDNTFRITDNVDSTKKTAFQSSGITTGTVRTITMADQDIDLTPTTGSYAAAGSGVSAGFAIAMSIAL